MEHNFRLIEPTPIGTTRANCTCGWTAEYPTHGDALAAMILHLADSYPE